MRKYLAVLLLLAASVAPAQTVECPLGTKQFFRGWAIPGDPTKATGPNVELWASQDVFVQELTISTQIPTSAVWIWTQQQLPKTLLDFEAGSEFGVAVDGIRSKRAHVRADNSGTFYGGGQLHNFIVPAWTAHTWRVNSPLPGGNGLLIRISEPSANVHIGFTWCEAPVESPTVVAAR